MKQKAKAQVADETDHLDLRSHAISDDKLQELLRIFPEAYAEGGKLDLDRLRLVVGEAVDVGKERYGLNWPGKAECFRTIQAPSLGTLRPAPAESVDWGETQNLIIEGDNLEVLKLLQKSYLGKVKMIYIDPPYNTGNDFIYPDDYTESLQTYLEYTGQVDSEGRKFGTNTDTDGRFHSKWLNMMYPRLYLARNLLRDDGVIFVSVDDNEHANLRLLLNDIFGEENFVTSITWRRTKNKSNQAIHFANVIDYILVYAKSKPSLVINHVSSEGTGYNYEDKKGKYSRNTILDKKRGSNQFSVTSPKGQTINGPWVIKKDEFERLEKTGLIHWSEGKKETPYKKVYLEDTGGVSPPDNFWDSKVHGSNQDGSLDIERIFGIKSVLEFPKPIELMKSIVRIGAGTNDIILDFFAGSGSIAQAILELNHEEDTSSRFVLVQLPEPCPAESVAFKAGFVTVAEIGKERIRRVIKKLDAEERSKLKVVEKGKQDRGFRVYKLAESNFRAWDADAPKDAKALQTQLAAHVHHIRKGRTEDDILAELLLKSGFPPTTPVETVTLAGKKVRSVAGGALLICLDRNLTLELIRAIAEQKPERVVCLDEGFAGHDQLKANAVQTFRTKGITSFKTV